MLRGVAVVWMPVQDIERGKGFYMDTLGTEIWPRWTRTALRLA
jgi:hypothetical protein